MQPTCSAHAVASAPRCVVRARVVARRPHEREGDWALWWRGAARLEHVERRVDHAAAREPRGCLGLRRVVHAAWAVGLAQLAVRRVGHHSQRDRRHLVQVVLRVRGQQLGVSRGPARQLLTLSDEAGLHKVVVRAPRPRALLDVRPLVGVLHHVLVIIQPAARLRCACHC
eukprot:scaffold25065_cov68-Phaeocystis_antarctica.AAC.2